MDEEDDRPRGAEPKKKDLQVMSVEALRAYLVELDAEKARVTDAIERKQKAQMGAEAFFKR